MSPEEDAREPRGTLSIRTLCMPADTNQNGDIFGGWLLGQMDIAGGIFASTLAKGRTATVAVDAMTFKKPVRVGDVVCAYADLIRVGTTSIAVHVEAWAIWRNERTASSSPKGTLRTWRLTTLDDRGRLGDVCGTRCENGEKLTLKYFAYGSNILADRLSARCPSAKALGRATSAGGGGRGGACGCGRS